MTTALDPHSIAHRVRSMVTQLGTVIRCPECDMTTFDGFHFDQRRDPLPGNQDLVDPTNQEDIDELLRAVTDMAPVRERICLKCGNDNDY